MWMQLTRLRLSLMVTVSALAGYLLCPGRPTLLRALPALLGVLLLAGGCSALNQVQERELDARMERTRLRPLPCGRLTVRQALLIALGLVAAGLAALAATGRPAVVLLGLLALVCYNLLYTPLKRLSVLALLPGACCGALPPLIGWAAAGGRLTDYRALLLGGLFFLWQIPHFWLLAARYDKDLERAGLPSIARTLGEPRARRLVRLWLVALTAAVVQLPLFHLVQGLPVRLALLTVLLWGLWCAWRAGRPLDGRGSGRLYWQLNLFMGMVLALLVLDGLWP